MIDTIYKVRSKKLMELGYDNYHQYLASDHWQTRRDAYEKSHERRCAYCYEYGHHLHHRTYRNLGEERDGELEWVCGRHHAEITKFGSIQPATENQKAILRHHRYAECFINEVTFGAAYELIGKLGRGEIQSPLQLGL